MRTWNEGIISFFWGMFALLGDDDDDDGDDDDDHVDAGLLLIKTMSTTVSPFTIQ